MLIDVRPKGEEEKERKRSEEGANGVDGLTLLRKNRLGKIQLVESCRIHLSVRFW